MKNNVQLLRELSAPLFELAEVQATLADCLTDPNCDEARLAIALDSAANARERAAPELLVDDLNQLFDDTLYGLEPIAERAVGLQGLCPPGSRHERGGRPQGLYLQRPADCAQQHQG